MDYKKYYPHTGDVPHPYSNDEWRTHLTKKNQTENKKVNTAVGKSIIRKGKAKSEALAKRTKVKSKSDTKRQEKLYNALMQKANDELNQEFQHDDLHGKRAYYNS